MLLLGIDPGTTGAMCAMDISKDGQVVLSFMDNKVNIIDRDIWLKKLIKKNLIMAIVEDVHSVPGTSAKSNFVFGWNVGEIHTLLKINNIGYDLVKPKVWQSKLGVSVPNIIKGPSRKKQIKNKVAKVCERIYPGCLIRGPKGGLLDGRSDALLITAYARFLYASGL